MSRSRNVAVFLSAACLALSVASIALASLANPEWEIRTPATTGIPGEEIRDAAFAPDGKLWVAARHPFWGKGGVGVLDLATQTWQVYGNTPNSPTYSFPSGYINDIAFSPDGSVWLATDLGLSHFVNGEWTTYTTANAPFLHNNIESVGVDPTGAVWVNNTRLNYTDGALHRFDGVNWTTWKGGSGLPWPTITPLRGPAIDAANGHVWIAAEIHAGLAEWNGSTWTLHPTISGDTPVANLKPKYVDAFGAVWCIGSPIVRFDESGLTLFGTSNTPFTNSEVMSMAMDDQGRIWAGNIIGQVIRQTAAGSTTWVMEYWNPNGHWVSGILPRPDGELWISHSGVTMDSGYVKHLNANDQLVHWYNTWNTGLPDFFVDGLEKDREGYMWVATGEGGISRLEGQRWRNWGNHNKNMEPYPWAGNEPMGGFFLDEAGTGWMGGNGIGRWSPATGQFTGFWDWRNNPPMGTTIYRYFAEDMNGQLFAAGDDAWIFKFNGASWDIDQFNAHYGIHSDSHGNVFALGGIPFEGLTPMRRWNGVQWSNYDVGLNLDETGATCFAIGPDDVLWIGTNDGLIRSENGVAQIFTQTNSPLPATRIQGIDIREDGLVGLSCHTFQSTVPFPNGVCVINGDPGVAANWHVFSYGTTPLPHYQLGDVEWDADGKLWVSAISEACAILDFQEPAAVEDPMPVRLVGNRTFSPNPFTGGPISYTLPRENIGPLRISLFSMSGRMLGSHTSPALNTSGQLELRDLVRDHSLPSGIYLLRAEDERGPLVQERLTILR